LILPVKAAVWALLFVAAHHHHHLHRATPGRAAPAPAVASVGSWEAVHVCEGTPWDLNGSFVGGLGIRRSTWQAYAPDLPIPASGPFPYSPATQVQVAERIQSTPPDESNGCVSW
jgi:hypothetical protein